MNEAAHAFTQGAERNAAFIASTPQGRRQALATMAEHTDHVPPEFVVNVIRAGALCVEAPRMIAYAAAIRLAAGNAAVPHADRVGHRGQAAAVAAAPPRATARSSRTPSGSSSTASATAHRWTCRSITAELILGAIA